jgi:hypothetical protein
MSKSQLTSSDVNPRSEYDENMILMVWDSYIRPLQGIQYFTGDLNPLLTLFRNDGDGMAPIKSAGLLVRGADNTLYINQFNHSVSICGPVDREINVAGSAVITANIEEAIKQILLWNNDPLHLQKINNHQIIFPYHITGGHWALGILELTLNAVGNLTDAKVNILNPLPDCGGRKMSNTAHQYVQKLLRDSFLDPAINLVNNDSPYNKQQNDGYSCGAISAENGKDFLDFKQIVNRLNIKYTTGAEDLRREHIKDINREDFAQIQFNQPPQDPQFNRPNDYNNLKEGFAAYINSLSQDNKEIFLNILKSKNDTVTAIEIKNFIKVHPDGAQPILSLFKIDANDWIFEGDHINTLTNIINDWGEKHIPSFSHRQSTKSKENNNNEAPEIQQNAFNKHDSLEYYYQYDDIRYIGHELIRAYNRSADSTMLKIIFIDPLWHGKDLGGLRVNAVYNLSKFKDDLDNHKAVGIFNTGGNHWIAYILFKDNGQIKCYYKDSLGKICKDFEQVFKDAFYKDETFVDGLIQPLGDKAEQNLDFEPLVDGLHQHVSCGIFALKNILELANINLLHTDSITFFTPGDTQEKYNQSIRETRQELAEKYLTSRIEETSIEKRRQEVPKIHRTGGEPEELQKLIGDDIQIKIEVLTLPEDSTKYQYRLTCTDHSQQIVVQEKLLKLSIQHTYQDNNADIFLIMVDQFKKSNIEIKTLLEIITKNNERLKQKEPQIELEICKEISESCSITSKTKALAIEILRKHGITKIPPTFAMSASNADIVTEIINNIDKALNCYQSGSATVENYDTIMQALYRISWRSSEIPREDRFSDKAIFKQYLDERDWIILDYLSNALVKFENPELSIVQKQKHVGDFLNRIQADLESLKATFYYQSKVNLGHINEFVSNIYDHYLLNKVFREINVIFNNIEDIGGDNKYQEFLTDKQNIYGLFRILEIIGECFKNFSPELLQSFFSDEMSLRFTQLRNDIHARSRLEVIVKYNKDIFKPILDITLELRQYIQNVVLPYLDKSSTQADGDFSLLRDPFIKAFDLSIIKDFRSILKAKPLILTRQIKDILESIDIQDQEVIARILYKLDSAPINSLDELEEFLNIKFNGYPAIKGKVKKIFDNIKQQQIQEKIVEFKQNLSNKILERDISGYNIKSILSDLEEFISNPEKVKAIADALLIPDNALAGPLAKIAALKQKFPEIFQNLDNISTIDELFKNLGKIEQDGQLKSSVDLIKKVYLKKLLVDQPGKTQAISFVEQQISTVQAVEVGKQITITKSNIDKMFPLIKRTEYLIKELEQMLIKLVPLSVDDIDLSIEEANKKDLLKLSAQYMLEDIGDILGGLIEYKEFQDYGYLSISKRQFYILNVARKAMAHHPLQIHEQMLEFYVDQLVLDSSHRLHDLTDKQLTVMGDEIAHDFIPRRNISHEELEQRKVAIKNIIIGNGFSKDFIGFSRKLGHDIGMQGDLVFVVFPIEDRASNLFELELSLGYFLNADIKVYTFDTLQQQFYRKITPQHRSEILIIEQFDDFLTTKKFEQIYDDGTWTKARIVGIGDVYKNQPIPKKDFAAATEVEYVFSQRYKNEQREKTKQFRQDRIDKVKEIEDIIIYKTSIYAQKICKVLNEIKEEIGLASLHRLFNILMLDRLLIQEVGEYFIKHEHEIQTKHPELTNITRWWFVNYAYKEPEEFFIKFPMLAALRKLIANKKSAFESLDAPMQKISNEFGFIVSQLRGTEIIDHIAKNIVHFGVKDNNWLLMPAVLTNLKEKYCNDSNILKIWLNKSLQQYGYLFTGENVQIPEDFILLEFSGEVEYAYLQRQETLTNQLQFRGLKIISQIFLDDLSVLENLENTCPNSTGYNYIVPYISNGILGFASELDRDLQHIHEQISGGNVGRRPLIPNLFIEDFIDRPELLQENNIIAIIPRIDTTYRFKTKVNTLKDLLELHETSTLLDEADARKIANYYEFRHIHDELNTVLCRIDKHIQKAKNLQELISKNNYVPTKQLQQQKLEKIIEILQQHYEEHSNLVEQIYDCSYTQERILKILQNPFELHRILTFVQSVPIEIQDNLLKNIISNAINTIKFAIRQELQINANLSEETTAILTDDKFYDHLIKLQKSLTDHDLDIEAPTFVSLSYPWDFDITGKLPSNNDNPCLVPRDTSSLVGETREESISDSVC